MAEASRSWWGRSSLPERIGIAFALLAAVLVLIGVGRGIVPLNVVSVGLALLIGAGSWGLVSWAVATAAVDVEQDISEGEVDGE